MLLLLGIVQPVAVGVDVVGIAAEQRLVGVGEPVAVGVGIGGRVVVVLVVVVAAGLVAGLVAAALVVSEPRWSSPVPAPATSVRRRPGVAQQRSDHDHGDDRPLRPRG